MPGREPQEAAGSLRRGAGATLRGRGGTPLPAGHRGVTAPRGTGLGTVTRRDLHAEPRHAPRPPPSLSIAEGRGRGSRRANQQPGAGVNGEGAVNGARAGAGVTLRWLWWLRSDTFPSAAEPRRGRLSGRSRGIPERLARPRASRDGDTGPPAGTPAAGTPAARVAGGPGRR